MDTWGGRMGGLPQVHRVEPRRGCGRCGRGRGWQWHCVLQMRGEVYGRRRLTGVCVFVGWWMGGR